MRSLYTILCLCLFLSCSNNDDNAAQSITTPPVNPNPPIEDPELSVKITQVGVLPEAVSNNAVVEGFIDDTPYIFSFGGIDETKSSEGIHRRSYRYNILTDQVEQLGNLPDTIGKIASGASRIGNIIYIAGGYYVFNDNSELTSGKMHRYDIANNVYLEDAADIPIPTDDHVQAVWRDQLIYLISGWNNTTNIPNVQVYNPISNSWLQATPVPNDSYQSFGASGTIIGDTIYYFGGATSNQGFDIQNQLRIGTINPDNPTEISWEIMTPNPIINGYRMGATNVNGLPQWIGGSKNTYNFDGIAYDGSGGVPPAKRILFIDPSDFQWQELPDLEIPMDLRGVASILENVKYTAGGMMDNQEVTAAIYKLEWSN